MSIIDVDNSDSVEFGEFRVICVDVDQDLIKQRLNLIIKNIKRNQNGNYWVKDIISLLCDGENSYLMSKFCGEDFNDLNDKKVEINSLARDS